MKTTFSSGYFKSLILMIFLIAPLMMFSQDTVPDPPLEEATFGAFLLAMSWKLFSPVFLGALTTAANHLTAGTMDWKAWLNDTALPALIAYIIALVLGSIDRYIGALDSLIELIFNIKTNANDIIGLSGVAFFLVPIIKGFFKKKSTQRKAALKKV